MERHKILTTAINHYGPDNQILKTMEEAGELIRALARFKIAMNAKEIDDSAWGNLAEEIADIEIMLQQIRLIIPGINRDIETIKEAKLIRLEQKLKERGAITE